MVPILKPTLTEIISLTKHESLLKSPT